MRKKICLVTGANSGIGKEIARGLAREGCTVVLACRNEIKGIAVQKELILETGNENVFHFRCDLSSQRSIRFFHERFRSQFDRLDLLVNNAAMYCGERLLSAEQVEMQFASNYLGPFILTGSLLDLMLQSPSGRIINMGSQEHFKGRIDFNHLPSIAKGLYNPSAAYAQSKLALILFTYELARQLEGSQVSVNCINPGRAGTSIGDGHHIGPFRLSWKMIRPLLKRPSKAAKPILDLSLSPNWEGISGKYFNRNKPSRSSQDSYDENLAKRLWTFSEELTGYPYDAFLATGRTLRRSVVTPV